MTAAHELAERGFQVTVVEAGGIAGGKARSLPVPDSAVDGREYLPAEHGFRFFPGFYQHVPDTMRRIPSRGQANGVLGNLRESTRVAIARTAEPPLLAPARFPRTIRDLQLLAHDVLRPEWDVSNSEVAHFIDRLFVLLSSCEERRFAEYEYQTWWQFSGAESRSAAYKKYLADGLTRTLVAARAREMSARTGGYILLQLLLDLAEPGVQVDRVLCGPTNTVWIHPWLNHLEALGVDYRFHTTVRRINCRDGRITGVRVRERGRTPETVQADYYVAAVPVERMVALATDVMKRAEPRLAELHKLCTRWMNGIMFYLHEPVSLVHGHSIYIDSPWSLTSVSQRQFWDRVDWDNLGDGRVGGIVSVDISEWGRPGILVKKHAMNCTLDEIKREVWAQLQAHLNRNGETVLDDANLHSCFLDEAVRFPEDQAGVGFRTDINLEPLLVNTAGSWDARPDSITAIENLFLASDYVRTHTDLACMEGANEAARRAVNGILDAAGSSAPRCEVWRLREPKVFAPVRALDQQRFKRRQPYRPLKRDAEGFYTADTDA
jgi:uncharacterized protein with NAD-binding domain and iron-sulfur cluster